LDADEHRRALQSARALAYIAERWCFRSQGLDETEYDYRHALAEHMRSKELGSDPIRAAEIEAGIVLYPEPAVHRNGASGS
jgi:hypothetical protein